MLQVLLDFGFELAKLRAQMLNAQPRSHRGLVAFHQAAYKFSIGVVYPFMISLMAVLGIWSYSLNHPSQFFPKCYFKLRGGLTLVHLFLIGLY